MSAAYERVRTALQGTSLEGEIDRLNADLRLTPDSPEWTLAALGIVGGAALQVRLEHAELSIVEALGNFPEALRASAVPIVETLAGDIRQQTVEGVREDAKSAIINILSRAIDAHEKVITNLSMEQSAVAATLTTAAAKLVRDSSTAVSQIEVRALTTASAFAQAAERLRGWSPMRIATVALGAMLLAGSFAFGLALRGADDHSRCSFRADHLAAISKLTDRKAAVELQQICGW